MSLQLPGWAVSSHSGCMNQLDGAAQRGQHRGQGGRWWVGRTRQGAPPPSCVAQSVKRGVSCGDHRAGSTENAQHRVFHAASAPQRLAGRRRGTMTKAFPRPRSPDTCHTLGLPEPLARSDKAPCGAIWDPKSFSREEEVKCLTSRLPSCSPASAPAPPSSSQRPGPPIRLGSSGACGGLRTEPRAILLSGSLRVSRR